MIVTKDIISSRRQHHLDWFLLPDTECLPACQIQSRRAIWETDIEVPNHPSNDQAQLHPSQVLANTIASSQSKGIEDFPVVIVELCRKRGILGEPALWQELSRSGEIERRRESCPQAEFDDCLK